MAEGSSSAKDDDQGVYQPHVEPWSEAAARAQAMGIDLDLLLRWQRVSPWERVLKCHEMMVFARELRTTKPEELVETTVRETLRASLPFDDDDPTDA